MSRPSRLPPGSRSMPSTNRERGQRREERARVKARKGIPVEGETTLGTTGPRVGSEYWRPLNMLYEVTVYPLLFGQFLLVKGRRDRDYWEVGYYYPDFSSAMSAADDWDGSADPGHGWINKRTTNARQEIEDAF